MVYVRETFKIINVNPSLVNVNTANLINQAQLVNVEQNIVQVVEAADLAANVKSSAGSASASASTASVPDIIENLTRHKVLVKIGRNI